MHCLADALKQIQQDLAKHVEPAAIVKLCRAARYRWRQRVLDPVTTIHLFVLQIWNGNVAATALPHLAKKRFTASAYCQARARLPLKIVQKLLNDVGRALESVTDGADRWLGHRVFLLDGSSFSMPDTPELRKKFGQPGVQKPGCGFPVAHLLLLFHAGTGLLRRVLAAPLRTHDMSQVAALHPELAAGDVLVGDRAFCSFAHLALILQRKMHAVFRVHQRQLVDFRPQRAHQVPGRGKARVGVPRSRWLEKLGVRDQLVEWFKPVDCPDWMTPAEFAALPARLVLRELRYRVTQRGFRSASPTPPATCPSPTATRTHWPPCSPTAPPTTRAWNTTPRACPRRSRTPTRPAKPSRTTALPR
jgi:hypothetical protein